MKKPKPPEDLTTAGKDLWRRIAEEIETDEPARMLLTELCRTFDRLQQAREILRLEGITVRDRFNQTRPHPCVAIERDCLAGLTRCWRLLGFDLAPPTGDLD